MRQDAVAIFVFFALGAACASSEAVNDVGPSAGGTAGSAGSAGSGGGSGGTGGSWAGGAGGAGGSAFGGSSGSAADAGGDAASDAIAGAGGTSSCGPEICNGADDDCNGTSDDGVCGPNCSGAIFGGKAYIFCNTQKSWPASVADCTAQGMSLARIDDAGEQAWIRSTATTRGLSSLWIGAGDATVEGQWIWLDGTQFWSGNQNGAPVAGLYSNWQGDEPNDDGTEDCAAVRDDGYWVDSECGGDRDYVCRQ